MKHIYEINNDLLKVIFYKTEEQSREKIAIPRAEMRTRYLLNTNQDKRIEENQIDATEWFIALIICSTCFGDFYAHHQEFEAILVLLPHMVCNALVAGGRLLGVEQQTIRPG